MVAVKLVQERDSHEQQRHKRDQGRQPRPKAVSTASKMRAHLIKSSIELFLLQK
jgi:hypothetical protein